MDAFGTSWAARSWEEEEGGLDAELSTDAFASPPAPAPARRSRCSERVAVDLGAGLRQRGASGVSVQILDLSTHGFRVATHLDLAPGADVWLRLPGLEACHAKVAWTKGHYVGCSFERPLHPAVLDMMVRKAQQLR